jgi:RNA 3'-terminal phosphate cyclase (ATP)
MLLLDGSYGEGGGQVLRTALALSAVTGQAIQLEHIRAGRRKPGIQPQHLTAVRAVARVCNAQVHGDRLGSQSLTFVPGSPPQPGTFTFDVCQVSKGGSAGAVSLVFQAVLMPLALAAGTSQLVLRGGTHVAWSPPFDYLKRVYLPTLARVGVSAKVQIERWGWYPSGGGEILATVHGLGPGGTLHGIDLSQRGALLRVRGNSVSSNLPKHIRTRQEGAALYALRSQGVNARIDVMDAPSKGQGTALFLCAESENTVAGFASLGALGKPAEQVAGEAAQALLTFLQSSAALDRHLADQLVLPLALAVGHSQFTTEEVTQHLLTVAWVVNQFFPGRIEVEGAEGGPGKCLIAATR